MGEGGECLSFLGGDGGGDDGGGRFNVLRRLILGCFMMMIDEDQ